MCVWQKNQNANLYLEYIVALKNLGVASRVTIKWRNALSKYCVVNIERNIGS